MKLKLRLFGTSWGFMMQTFQSVVVDLFMDVMAAGCSCREDGGLRLVSGSLRLLASG